MKITEVKGHNDQGQRSKIVFIRDVFSAKAQISVDPSVVSVIFTYSYSDYFDHNKFILTIINF